LHFNAQATSRKEEEAEQIWKKEAKKVWKKEQHDSVGNGGISFVGCTIGAFRDGTIGVGDGSNIHIGSSSSLPAASSEKKCVTEEESELQDEGKRLPQEGKRCKSNGGALGIPMQKSCSLLHNILSMLDPQNSAIHKGAFSPSGK